MKNRLQGSTLLGFIYLGASEGPELPPQVHSGALLSWHLPVQQACHYLTRSTWLSPQYCLWESTGVPKRGTGQMQNILCKIHSIFMGKSSTLHNSFCNSWTHPIKRYTLYELLHTHCKTVSGPHILLEMGGDRCEVWDQVWGCGIDWISRYFIKNGWSFSRNKYQQASPNIYEPKFKTR